ncbi:hypothetical protein SVIO_047000 [Streptomyces violaceusniger]|uniref:beta-N-acetylhexosaminidase n=1 Tax=Streptomyces violaceusniger TaxID=68280 RepID=A0A4D4L5Z5_STRVO|nr:hypothetical protein SVIO_047000 [Streptomyces violaceusniger]
MARLLRTTLGQALGLSLPDGEPGGDDTISLRIDAALEPEGYRLTVADGRVEIAGGTAAGVHWGTQTLRQLLGPDAFRRAPLRDAETGWELAERTVEDTPRFAWRGLMLDVARHFMPKDGVLAYLDLLAAHKLNVFHFHLTDDQGWRIEIRHYPKLTETGAWRERTKLGHRASPLWDERPHGGHYTQDDIREIVAYAAERHITVVPEIDIPGHSQAAIAAYPELGNTDVIDTASLGVWTTWGINPNVLSPPTTRSASTRTCSRRSWSCSPAPSSTSAATSAPRTSGRRPRPPRSASAPWAWPTRTSCRAGSSATSAGGSPSAAAG